MSIPTPEPVPSSTLASAALITANALAVLFLAPSLVLLCDPASLAGFVAALTALQFLALPSALAWSLTRKRRQEPRAFLPLLLPGLLALAGLTFLTWQRSRPQREQGRVRSIYPRDRGFSVFDLVPEADQIRLGARLAWIADPWIDRRQSRRLRDLMTESYAAIAEDPDLAPLGSSLDETYADVLGLDHFSGHLYDIRPPRPDPKAPLLIFVHGNVGNFKAYLGFWKRYSERSGARIVAPSFGNGHWNRPGGIEAIAAARAYALRDSSPRSITLAGLSNGGRGVGRAALAAPGDYDRLWLISPVMEPAVYEDPAFLKAWKGRELRVIHGVDDRRLPAKALGEVCAAMRAAGVKVRLELVAEEDHFLLLSRPGLVLDLLGAKR